MLWPDPERGPWYIRANWVTIEDRLECVGLIVWHGAQQDPDNILGYCEMPGSAPTPLLATELRAVPWQTIIRALRRKVREQNESYRQQLREQLDDPRNARIRDLLAVEAEAVLAGDEAQRTRGRPRAYGPAHYARVAELYLQAVREDESPTALIARELGGSRSAAAKWVSKARHEYGLLDRSPGPGRR
jgi:hypothetical protein